MTTARITGATNEARESLYVNRQARELLIEAYGIDAVITLEASLIDRGAFHSGVYCTRMGQACEQICRNASTSRTFRDNIAQAMRSGWTCRKDDVPDWHALAVSTSIVVLGAVVLTLCVTLGWSTTTF